MNEWPQIELGQLADFRNGLNYSAAHSGSGLAVVGIPNFKDSSFVDFSDLSEIDPSASSTDEALILKNDILFVRSNGNRELIGRSLLVTDDPPKPTSHSGFTIRMRLIDQQADAVFYAYYLRSRAVRRQLSSQGGGTAINNLNQGILSRLTVPRPPLAAQRSIASILSSYDDLIENNRRRIALLEEAARQLYKEWFVRFRFPGHEHVKIIDGVPEGWTVNTIDEVCQTIGGGTPSTQKAEYWDHGDVLWFTPTDVTRNSCLALLNSEKSISDSGLNNSSAKMIPAGSILMTSRASVGFFGINRFAASTNQGFINIVANDPALRMYLLQNLMWRVEEIRSHAGGATYKEISKGRFRALPILVPPLSLAGEFEDQMTLLHAQVETLHIANQQLTRARDLLLPKLMSGAIAV